MPWTENQIEQHIQAANALEQIKNEIFRFISSHTYSNEFEIQQNILKMFREKHLRTYLGTPIVAFGPSAANPHYFPTAKGSIALQPETLIMIDIWARQNRVGAPFGDITWMAYHGSNPSAEIRKAYKTVIKARDAVIEYIQLELDRGEMPLGFEADAAARYVIADAGFAKHFIHSTGHSIGTTSPHGRYGGLRRTNLRQLQTSLGYTIEPGIYLKNKFGVRSEINFYINVRHKLIITTPTQTDLVFL